MKRIVVLLVVGLLASVSVIAASPAGAKKGHPKKTHVTKAKKRGVVHGIVEAVGSDSVTLKTKKGLSVTIDVDADTKIIVNRKPGALADIEVGYRAAAKPSKNGGAARWLRAYERPAPGLVVHGAVESVGSDSITVKKKNGDSVTIDVTANTKIRVNGKAAELADIEAGDRAIVKRTSPNGPAAAIKTFHAGGRRVVVHGVVDSVGSDSITIKLRNGASATIDVTAATRIRVAGHAATLADIHAGYRALVLRGGADGPALAIIARAPHS